MSRFISLSSTNRIFVIASSPRLALSGGRLALRAQRRLFVEMALHALANGGDEFDVRGRLFRHDTPRPTGQDDDLFRGQLLRRQHHDRDVAETGPALELFEKLEPV